jgi:hypothetical protein
MVKKNTKANLEIPKILQEKFKILFLHTSMLSYINFTAGLHNVTLCEQQTASNYLVKLETAVKGKVFAKSCARTPKTFHNQCSQNTFGKPKPKIAQSESRFIYYSIIFQDSFPDNFLILLGFPSRPPRVTLRLFHSCSIGFLKARKLKT